MGIDQKFERAQCEQDHILGDLDVSAPNKLSLCFGPAKGSKYNRDFELFADSMTVMIIHYYTRAVVLSVGKIYL